MKEKSTDTDDGMLHCMKARKMIITLRFVKERKTCSEHSYRKEKSADTCWNATLYHRIIITKVCQRNKN
jgi:hypothetical protein